MTFSFGRKSDILRLLIIKTQYVLLYHLRNITLVAEILNIKGTRECQRGSLNVLNEMPTTVSCYLLLSHARLLLVWPLSTHLMQNIVTICRVCNKHCFTFHQQCKLYRSNFSWFKIGLIIITTNSYLSVKLTRKGIARSMIFFSFICVTVPYRHM